MIPSRLARSRTTRALHYLIDRRKILVPQPQAPRLLERLQLDGSVVSLSTSFFTRDPVFPEV